MQQPADAVAFSAETPDGEHRPDPAARRLDRLRRPIAGRSGTTAAGSRPRPPRPPTAKGGPEELFVRPTSLFLSAPSPTLIPWVLYGLAHAGSPRFHWVQLEDPAPAPVSPAEMGWIPPDCRWTLPEADLRGSSTAAEPRGLASLLQRDDDGEAAARLLGFLRLPDIAQRILSEPPPAGRSGVLVVPNAQRADGVCPWFAAAPLIELLAGSGYSLVVGCSGAPSTGRAAFATILRLEESSAGHWQDARLICEKGAAPVPLRSGTSARLVEIPYLATVLRRADLGR